MENNDATQTESRSWYDEFRDVDNWRLYLGFFIIIQAFLFRKVFVILIIKILKRIFGTKKYGAWILDIEKYSASSIAWLIFCGWMYLAFYCFDLLGLEEVNTTLLFGVGIPIIWFTITMRQVLANAVISYFKWKQSDADSTQRRMMVQEGFVVIIYFIVLIEFLVIYLWKFDFTTPAIYTLIITIELSVALASFTTLKNYVSGLTLVVKEPFRAGSLCRIGKSVGKVLELALRDTKLKQADGSVVCIPNSIFLNEFHQNLSHCHTLRLEFHLRIRSSVPTRRIDILIPALRESLLVFTEESDDTAVTKAANVAARFGSSCSMMEHFSTRDSTSMETNGNDDDDVLLVKNRGSRSSSSRLRSIIRTVSNQLSAEIFVEGESQSPSSSRHKRRQNQESAIEIRLNGLHRLGITLLVKVVEFQSIPALKSKINMAILETAEPLGVQLY